MVFTHCKLLSANSTLVLEEREHKIQINVRLCCAILCIVKDWLLIPANNNIYYKDVVILIMQKGQMGNHPPENFEEPYIGGLESCYTEPRVDGSI